MRAQITIFIIIGLLVLISFGLIIYTNSTQQQTPKTQTNTIKDYITTCLKLTATEALTLIGLQGGTIYAEQGGKTTQKEHLNYYGTKTPYTIIPPQGNINDIYYSETPEYPFPDFPYVNNKITLTGYYGQNKLPPLHRPHTESIQENIEEYINTNIQHCTNWQTYEQQGYTITTGTPNTTITLPQTQQQIDREQQLTIELNWDVTTTRENEQTKETHYATQLPIKLAKIYYEANRIITEDITNITYEPESKEFQITKENHDADTIITITDTTSKLNDKPYQFKIARKNRAPALWKIPDTTLTVHQKPDGTGTKITITQNSLILVDPCDRAQTIPINSTDPDENELKHLTSPTELKITDTILTISTTDGQQTDKQTIPVKVAICEVR